MKISIGQTLGEYGFQFYEKLRYPIMLIDQNGHLLKINEAGRKLLKVTSTPSNLIEKIFCEYIELGECTKTKRQTTKTRNLSRLHIIAKKLSSCDYYLVEIIK